MRRAVTTLVLVSAVTMCLGMPGARAWPGNARYSVSRSTLDAALACRGGKDALDGRGRKQPVLLVHGTGITRRQSWGWNYWMVLPQRGFEVCWVALPDVALNDAQISAEYVARAVGFMHNRTREKVDVLGHSQGGLEPRWAIKWFPAGARVADYIGLASPNHGTVTADAATTNGSCFPSCWQMRTVAAFIEALNRGNETPGRIPYTNIYSTSDELVQPAGTSALEGGKNILIQDICPGRPVDHASILGDFVTFKLVMDALVNPGPAWPRRLPGNVCARASMPGSEPAPAEMARITDYSQGERTESEPPLKPYATRG